MSVLIMSFMARAWVLSGHWSWPSSTCSWRSLRSNPGEPIDLRGQACHLGQEEVEVEGHRQGVEEGHLQEEEEARAQLTSGRVEEVGQQQQEQQEQVQLTAWEGEQGAHNSRSKKSRGRWMGQERLGQGRRGREQVPWAWDRSVNVESL